MKTIFVGYDRNRGIGVDNDLPWGRDLPADLRRFKLLTTGNALIMGRKTFESLPGALPGRLNIVVSRGQASYEGATVVGSLQEAYDAARDYPETFIGGGQEIYRQALPDADRIYATEVDAEFPAERFFPELDMSVWQETAREHHEADERNRYNYDFVTYTKKLL